MSDLDTLPSMCTRTKGIMLRGVVTMRDSEFEHAHPDVWRDERKDTFEPTHVYVLSILEQQYAHHWRLPLRREVSFDTITLG